MLFQINTLYLQLSMAVDRIFMPNDRYLWAIHRAGHSLLKNLEDKDKKCIFTDLAAFKEYRKMKLKKG